MAEHTHEETTHVRKVEDGAKDSPKAPQGGQATEKTTTVTEKSTPTQPAQSSAGTEKD